MRARSVQREKKRKKRRWEGTQSNHRMPLPLPLKILALRTMQIAAKGWIDGDESAAEMLGRVATERPFLLLPPLHRVPLRVGNVVELVGPSASAKTHILIQVSKKKKNLQLLSQRQIWFLLFCKLFGLIVLYVIRLLWIAFSLQSGMECTMGAWSVW